MDDKDGDVSIEIEENTEFEVSNPNSTDKD
jgi:hypothetical protein